MERSWGGEQALTGTSTATLRQVEVVVLYNVRLSLDLGGKAPQVSTEPLDQQLNIMVRGTAIQFQ